MHNKDDVQIRLAKQSINGRETSLLTILAVWWLVGWLDAWLDGRMDGWLVGRSVSWSVSHKKRMGIYTSNTPIGAFVFISILLSLTINKVLKNTLQKLKLKATGVWTMGARWKKCLLQRCFASKRSLTVVFVVEDLVEGDNLERLEAHATLASGIRNPDGGYP